LAADVLGRVLGLEGHGVRATTLKFGEAQAQGDSGSFGGGGSGFLFDHEDSHGGGSSSQEGTVPGRPLLQQQGRLQLQGHRLEGDAAPPRPLHQRGRSSAGGRGRHLLRPGGKGGLWQCWALDAARLVGGERLARKLQRWVLL
jgi:hypothetical protein